MKLIIAALLLAGQFNRAGTDWQFLYRDPDQGIAQYDRNSIAADGYNRTVRIRWVFDTEIPGGAQSVIIYLEVHCREQTFRPTYIVGETRYGAHVYSRDLSDVRSTSRASEENAIGRLIAAIC